MQRQSYFEQFELQAETRPDAIAIDLTIDSTGGGAITGNALSSITYDALNRRANRIAHALRAAGIAAGQNHVVGLFLDPGSEYVAALLATGKAGAVFLPLPTDLPPARLAVHLAKTRCGLVLTDAAHRPLLEEQLARSGGTAIVLSTDAGLDNQPEHNPGIAVRPGDGCYVMFTSGSTGVPKAILGQQRGLSHFLRWELAEFALGSDTRVSWLAPITFDVSLRDILLPLMAGGTLCIPHADLRTQPHRLVAWIAASRLTLIHCVPTLLRLLVRALEHEAPASAPFPDLRYLMVAGEPLLGADVAAWRAVAGNRCQLVNLYGPSETTLAKLFHRIDALPDDPRRVMPIGQPLPNTAVLILNQGRLCATGEIGEIHLRTPYRSLGYMNDPELSAAVFIQNPLNPENPDVLYKTGDLGRILPDGNVECLGRQDNQVKINGIRIELAEVEAALRQANGVADAVCAIHRDTEQRPLLVGYYTRADGATTPLPLAGLKDDLDRILPAAMQPHLTLPLDRIPTTVSGKINRKALPRPEELYYPEGTFVAPETPSEQALAAIWSELFGIRRVGVNTGFHVFGGDSLRAIRAVMRIYQTCGVEISLKDFFTDTRIRALAARIDGMTKAVATIPRLADAASYPATPAQSRLWRLDRMGIAPTAYNLPEAFELSGPVDADALEEAVRALIRRHESLRTTFCDENNTTRQVVHADLPWQLQRGDLRPLGDAAEGEAHRLAESNRQHCFDLERGPLLHALLARLPDLADGTPRHLFLFNIHHIVSDVWSLGVLVRELALVYSGLRQGSADPANRLPPLPLQQRDVAGWQATRLNDDTLEADRRYWRERFAGALPVLELPTDRPRPPVQTFNGTTHRFRFSADASARLLALAEAQGTTLFVTLTALTKALLNRYSGQRDLIVGSPVAGRDHPDLDGQIGYLVNILALRDHIDPAAPFTDLLAGVGRTVADGIAHQAYPFDALIDDLNLTRDMSRSPLFDVMVVAQTFEPFALTLEGASARPFGPENLWNFSRYDLVFHFENDDGELVLDLNYNRDLFDAARIARICAHFAELATAAVLSPHSAVESLPLLPPAERATIDAFTAGPPVARPAWTIPSLLAAVVARHPARPALVEAGRQLDFTALEHASDRLASALANRHGVAPQDRVAVLAQRSIESVLALLAIVKAGAVYVPLDPDTPASRLSALIEQADCHLILVDRPGDETLLPVASPPALAVATLLGAEMPFAAPVVTVTPQDVAYLIFTSGSTGQPKAVMVEHAGFVNMALGQIEAFGLEPDDRVVQFASPAFDASLANIFMALFAGAAVVLPGKPVIESTPLFLEFLATTASTVLTLPPTYLRTLERAAMPSLRVLISAGEAAPVADLAHYAHTLRAFNAYGPTEASVCATLYRVTPEDATRPRLPIGHPLPNTTLHILDTQGEPVPLGIPGEIHLGGIGLARGYQGDEAQTAARFITHRSGERLYRSGDIACWLSDGNVDFLGRSDDQVKISGHRIELGEVELALRSTPGVRDGIVTTVPRADGSLALAAYYCVETPVELWPSVAEFFVYDEVAYSIMAADEARNQRYRDAFARHLPGKTVIDIGTGPFAILARLALEAGARKVYAIDRLESTANKARETVARLGLSDRIEVIHGDALNIELPEPVDVCISEIVGAIGGSEGAAKIINDARRFLKDPSQMLPQRSVTRIAAVSLPEGSLAYGFPAMAADYVEKIFAEVGRPFDLRLCLKNLPRQAIVSSAGIFEDLDHTAPTPLETTHTECLTVERAEPITGLLLWLQLHVDADHVVDILDHPGSWLPVYLPISLTGIPAQPGDRIHLRVTRTLCNNGLNPDFTVNGRIEGFAGDERAAFRCVSAHFGEGFQTSPFYQRLFPSAAVPRADSVTPLAVRRHLANRLPGYAIPAHLIALAALPVTINGKVDRAALPPPVATATAATCASVTPTGALETAILNVWRSVLERADLGVDDDFFLAGGDSIRAIQIVSRLRSLGLPSKIRDIFENPTVTQFAALVTPLKAEPMNEAPIGSPIGSVPLTPIQRWFFETMDEALHHFNQAVMLRASGSIDIDATRTALAALWRHHDALRAVFATPTAGRWPCQTIRPPDGAPTLTLLDLGKDEETTLAEAADRLHASFQLADGPLFAALLARGADSDRLLLVAHHLVVDSVSWNILLEDFQAAYETALAGDTPLLPEKTASYRDYSETLTALSAKIDWNKQLAYWQQVSALPPEPLFRPNGEPSRAADRLILSATLDRATTTDLLGPAHYAYTTRSDDLLLSALALALRDRMGRQRTLVTLESHGRDWPFGADAPVAQPDLTRSVGWFTAHYPFLLEAGSDPDTGALIKGVKEALRRVPDRGWSYGLLTHPMGDGTDAPPRLAPLAGQIGFNFLGHMTSGQSGGRFAIDWEAPGQALSPRTQRPHGLEILGMVVDGELTIRLEHDRALEGSVAEGLLHAFLKALTDIAEHCLERSSSEAIPSDFTCKNLSLEDSGALLRD